MKLGGHIIQRPNRQGSSSVLSVVLYIALWCSISAAAQQSFCDKAIMAPSGSPYGYRLRGDRCEGIYVQELATTTLQIVSLIESFEDYDLTAANDLRVMWRFPGDEAITLRARSLKPRLYYRMDTSLPAANRFYTWPKGILASLNIHKQAIGVLGWSEWEIGETRQRVYLPLRINQLRAPAHSDAYQLILLPGRQLSEVYVRLAKVTADGHLGDFLRDGEPLRYGQYSAGRGVVFTITGLETPGIYYLEIGADLTDGGVAGTHIFFYHAGR